MDGAGMEKFDQDQIVVDILHQGPLPFSISRYNQGDLAPRIGPRWPYSQHNLGNRPMNPGGSAPTDQKDHSVQAWRPHRKVGVMLATVAKNGQNWGDGQFFGTVAAATSSGGYGFSMLDGTFGPGDCDICLGKAGKQLEANIDVAVAWVPYGAGFVSGYVDKPGKVDPDGTVAAKWQEEGSHSVLLAEKDQDADASSTVEWVIKGEKGEPEGGMYAVLRLPGYTCQEGMLFAIATDDSTENNNLNTVGVRPLEDGKGWKVQVHEDFDPSKLALAKMEEWSFAFLLVPWSGTIRLHGAHVRAETGELYKVGGDMQVRKLEAGVFLVEIEGKTGQDGVLLLQCAGQPTDWAGTSSAFLSYEWHESRMAFEVQIRHVKFEEGSGESFVAADMDFYVLWMDHKHPPVTLESRLTNQNEYVGCLIGDIDPQLADYTGRNHASETCAMTCSAYRYSLLHNGGECYCTDFLSDDSGWVDDGACGKPCSGQEKADPPIYCGTDSRSAVYQKVQDTELKLYTCYYYDDFGLPEIQDSDPCKTTGDLGVGADAFCVFPFVYGGKMYRSCTTVDSFFLWCATAVDGGGDYVPGQFGQCSKDCKVLERCECQEKWTTEDSGCEEEQHGCPEVACDAVSDPASYEPWCKVSNPGCATEEFVGWSYCSNVHELGNVRGQAWLGPLERGGRCDGPLQAEADAFRGSLATTLEQCKTFCVADRDCKHITFYANMEGCHEEYCLVGGRASRCKLSESCASVVPNAAAGTITVIFEQVEGSSNHLDHIGRGHFRTGLLCGALSAGAAVVAVVLFARSPWMPGARSARSNLPFRYGHSLPGAEGMDSDGAAANPL